MQEELARKLRRILSAAAANRTLAEDPPL
jgi:hypothetical protein